MKYSIGTKEKWGFSPKDGLKITSTITLDDEEKANSILISKAPEMLEMLSRVIETFTPTVNSPLEQSQEDLLNNIKNIIKEATEL
jgi:hypothetical protein